MLKYLFELFFDSDMSSSVGNVFPSETDRETSQGAIREHSDSTKIALREQSRVLKSVIQSEPTSTGSCLLLSF